MRIRVGAYVLHILSIIRSKADLCYSCLLDVNSYFGEFNFKMSEKQCLLGYMGFWEH